MNRLVVFGVDIGSVAKGRFAWAKGTSVGISRSSSDIRELVSAAAADLDSGLPVAMGFECPLYVPISTDPQELTSPREGEGNRPWSAAAGATLLATGIAEIIWILREIHVALQLKPHAFLDWDLFVKAGTGLYLWEAFAPNQRPYSAHTAVAQKLVRLFVSALPNPTTSNAIDAAAAHSLIGAALLHTGWSTDLSLLKTRCVVIKVQ